MENYVFDASLYFSRRVSVTADTQESAEKIAAKAARAMLESAGLWPNDYNSQDLAMTLVTDVADGPIDREVFELESGGFVEVDENGDEVESEYDDEVE